MDENIFLVLTNYIRYKDEYTHFYICKFFLGQSFVFYVIGYYSTYKLCLSQPFFLILDFVSRVFS